MQLRSLALIAGDGAMELGSWRQQVPMWKWEMQAPTLVQMQSRRFWGLARAAATLRSLVRAPSEPLNTNEAPSRLAGRSAYSRGPATAVQLSGACPACSPGSGRRRSAAAACTALPEPSLSGRRGSCSSSHVWPVLLQKGGGRLVPHTGMEVRAAAWCPPACRLPRFGPSRRMVPAALPLPRLLTHATHATSAPPPRRATQPRDGAHRARAALGRGRGGGGGAGPPARAAGLARPGA